MIVEALLKRVFVFQLPVVHKHLPFCQCCCVKTLRPFAKKTWDNNSRIPVTLPHACKWALWRWSEQKSNINFIQRLGRHPTRCMFLLGIRYRRIMHWLQGLAGPVNRVSSAYRVRPLFRLIVSVFNFTIAWIANARLLFWKCKQIYITLQETQCCTKMLFLSFKRFKVLRQWID